MKKYYSLASNGTEADIYIFGDIVDPISQELWGLESDTSGLSLANDVKDLDVGVINVHINSYGGSVSEGLAIHSTLRNHKAKVRTICDGFACSAASVVFMAGDERIMNNASLLMIHNAWMVTAGNAGQLRKDADDLEIISKAAAKAYAEHVNISEEALAALLDAETWILPEDALEMGFATSIVGAEQTNKAAASAHKALFSLLKSAIKMNGDVSEDPEPEPEPEPEQDPAPEPKENKTIKFLSALIGGKE